MGNIVSVAQIKINKEFIFPKVTAFVVLSHVFHDDSEQFPSPIYTYCFSPVYATTYLQMSSISPILG